MFLFPLKNLITADNRINLRPAAKGPSIKDVGSQGEFVQFGYFSDKGVIADVRAFWRKKLRIFRNLWCVRTDKGEGC